MKILSISIIFGGALVIAGCQPMKTGSTDHQSYYPNASYNCPSSGVLKRQTLAQINRIRAQARRCGGRVYRPASPVRWNSKLENAAHAHSRDMASNDFFEHIGTGGLKASDRVGHTGYLWRSVGENIYAGAPHLQEAIDGWVDSSSHCATIMNPDFEEMGVACDRSRSSYYGTYYTQVFGTRR